jgi:hypothetical protein
LKQNCSFTEIAAPTNLVLTPSGSSILLDWVDNTGGNFDSYEIWRGTELNSLSLYGTTTNADNYTDSSIVFDVIYYYQVRVVEGSQNSGFSNKEGEVICEGAVIPQFTSTWDTGATDTITLPLPSSGGYDFTVFYNGNAIKTVTNYTDNIVTFPDGAGEKVINIEGIIRGWNFNNSGDKLKILNISNWGTFNIGNTNSQFFGCDNLTISATDELDNTGVFNLLSAFHNCDSLSSIPLFDISQATNLKRMFRDSGLTSSPLFNLESMTDGTDMFLNVTLDTPSIDGLISTLVNNTNNNVTLHLGDGYYSAASVALIATLTSAPRNWTIISGGLEP